MAENINIIGGVASFTSTEKAWHGLGTIVKGAMTSKEALTNARLNFEVSKKQLYTATNLVATNTFGTFRDDIDQYLGTVGKDYTVVQNVDCFTFFDSIVGEGKAIFETAGALGKGEKVFITAKLPSDIIVGNDVIEQYLFLYNSHDGSAAVTCAFTPVRIVCNNTLVAALRNCSNKVSIKHTKNVLDSLSMAHQLMGIIAPLKEEYSKVYNKMLDVKITDERVRELIEMALKPQKEQVEDFSKQFKNVVDGIFDFTMSDSTQKGISNTLWGVYNGVTGYYNNVQYNNANDKMNSILFGNYNKKAQSTLNLLQQLV